MNFEDIQLVMEENISDLEKGMYRYESIIKPRYERDKEILESMRDKYIKLCAVIKKAESGEATQKDIMDAVPKQFQGADNQKALEAEAQASKEFKVSKK